jgi:uncharacterized protein involved in type VI secretion and phage assembly
MSTDRHLGVMIGVVSDRKDEENLGRVKVTFPTLKDRESDWARVMVPFGGTSEGDHGFFAIPEEGDHVVVAFDQGDPKVPIVIGSVYSRARKPPTTNRDERMLKTRKGHYLLISDVKDDEKIELKTSSGQYAKIDEKSKTVSVFANQKIDLRTKAGHHVTIDDQAQTIEVTTNGGQSIKLDDQAQKITAKANQAVEISAPQITLDGSTTITLKSPTVVVDATSIGLGGSGGTEPVIKGKTLITDLLTHTHQVPGVMAGPTAATSLPSAQFTNQYLSTKTTLKE